MASVARIKVHYWPRYLSGQLLAARSLSSWSCQSRHQLVDISLSDRDLRNVQQESFWINIKETENVDEGSQRKARIMAFCLYHPDQQKKLTDFW